MIVRRCARLALVAALPLFAVAACGSEPPERSPAAPATAPSPQAAEAGRMRQSIEAAAFQPEAPPASADGTAADGSTRQNAAGGGATNGQTADGSSANRGGAVEGALPQDAKPDPAMVRAQILLDRTRFSPGIVDGLGGENTRQAIAAFEEANDLEADGELDAEVFQRLASGDDGPVLMEYTITSDDAGGPFIGPVPTDMQAMAALETVGYADAREAMAERFHMSPELLTALNPEADFGRAGQTIVVAATGPAELEGEVARIVIDKGENSLRAFDADGKLLAFYPATIGSSETPSPTGTHTVRAIAPAPNYTYDPSRVTTGKSDRTIVIPAGPNNPVGGTWIDLSRDTYGIHGTPEPSLIGKTASSGCVRLTNWDVQHLAAAVKPGVTVVFR